MNRLEFMLGNLTYRSFSPVSKVLQFIWDISNEAHRNKDKSFIRQLMHRIDAWQVSINNSRLYYEYRENIAIQQGQSYGAATVIWNLKKTDRLLSDLLISLNKMLEGKYRTK